MNDNMIRYLLFFICLSFWFPALAQQKNIIDELQKNRVGEGVVTIHQDASISALLGSVYVKDENAKEPKVLKARGNVEKDWSLPQTALM